MKTRIMFVLIVLTPAGLWSQSLVDSKATPQTKYLYNSLRRISEMGVMFGHQDDDAYGVGWKEEEGRSDVKSVTGSYPAVHGWDLGHIEIGKGENLDGVKFDKMRNWITAAYKRGGISTVSWHGNNPVSKGSTWDKTPAVKDILPGGSHHTTFLSQLDLLSDFLKSCKVPLIFRPYHEHNGDWFWWGKGNCTEEEYIQLWRFTVTYLRDTKGVHNLLYTFSPDRSRWNLSQGAEGYLYGYPGDEYVDILGVDNYMDVRDTPERTKEQRVGDLVKSLTLLCDVARQKNKVAVLSETGEEGVKNAKWFTETITEPLKANPQIRIAYVLNWRNAFNRPNHFYAPYPGHPAADDLKTFFNNPTVFFESEIQNMYKSGKPLVKK